MKGKRKDDTVTKKVLVVMDVTTYDDTDPDDEFSSDIGDTIVEGITSVDMEKAMAECLATWYLQLLNEDVTISVLDAQVVDPKAKVLPRYRLRRSGGLQRLA